MTKNIITNSTSSNLINTTGAGTTSSGFADPDLLDCYRALKKAGSAKELMNGLSDSQATGVVN